MYTCNLVGSGRLGKTVLASLMRCGALRLLAVFNRTVENSELCIQQLGVGRAVNTLDALPAVDITFVTTTDASISSVISALNPEKCGLIAHCSGILRSTELLAPGSLLKVASIHPLKSFTNRVDNDGLRDCHCFAEGHPQALQVLTDLFAAAGAIVHPIDGAKKANYHCGAVMASNYLVTLFAEAIDLLQQAGIDATTSRIVVQQLMHGTLENLARTKVTEEALTGPLARGDTNTIVKHLAALENTSTLALYKNLAQATLPLTALSTAEKTNLEGLFA